MRNEKFIRRTLLFLFIYLGIVFANRSKVQANDQMSACIHPFMFQYVIIYYSNRFAATVVAAIVCCFLLIINQWLSITSDLILSEEEERNQS